MAETRYSGDGGFGVLRRIADVGPVEYRVVERRLVLDRRVALDLIARSHGLDRDVRAAVRVREDLEEFEWQDATVRQVDDAVGRKLRGRVEDSRVPAAAWEQPRNDG